MTDQLHLFDPPTGPVRLVARDDTEALLDRLRRCLSWTTADRLLDADVRPGLVAAVLLHAGVHDHDVRCWLRRAAQQRRDDETLMFELLGVAHDLDESAQAELAH